MPADPTAVAELRRRLDVVEAEGKALQSEGLPFPTTNVRATFEAALRSGTIDEAASMVKRAEALLARARRDWTWVRELFRRVDEMRSVAETIGVDVAHLDARVGNPRSQLMAEPLSAGSLEKAAASASLSLAVLNDAVPKFCAREAQGLGRSIRKARDRGEEVRSAAASFSRLLQAMQDQVYTTVGTRLVETRREVARIPRAPTVAAVTPAEEEEILREARNLARRLQRIKTGARDAHSAARLMTQVRAALSEDRRYGTPEEEIEALWNEVDRLAREKRLAGIGPPLSLPAYTTDELAQSRETETTPASTEPAATDREETPPLGSEAETDDHRRLPPLPYYLPYLPPELPPTVEEPGIGDGAATPGTRRPRGRSRP